MGTLFIIDAIKQGFIGIILTLDTLIFGLIGSAFKIFIALAGARLLTSETYFEIANKLYVIIGVLMLFVLAYAILRGIVDPDPDKSIKEHAGPKMLKNIIIAVLGLALAPSIFNLMYQAQGLILEQDVLGKIFFRIENTELVQTSDGEKNPDEYVKQIGGSVTATSLWQAFFHPSPDSGLDASEIEVDASGYFVDGAVGLAACAAGIGIMGAAGWTGVGLLVGGVIALFGCGSAAGNIIAGTEAINYDNLTLEQAYNLTSGGQPFGIYTAFLSCYTDDGSIEYLFIISTIAGAFALYAFVSFSIDMGIRAAKLAYLQIIAPVPLVMQVLPKFQENFKKYISSVTSTFLEVFVRISVVYVVVYIICHLSDMFSTADALWGNADLSTAELLFAYAFLILGLIAFCRHAPEMITQTLGLPKGDMHLGIGKKLAEGGAFSAGSIAYGGVTSAVRNWNSNKGKGIGRQVTSALGGMSSGVGRAVRENFLGPNHKEAQTWSDMKNVGERAAQGATDARDARNQRKEDLANSQKNYAAAKTAYDQALADYNFAPTSDNRDKLEEARKALRQARDQVINKTAVGSFVNKQGEKITAWSIGTVSTAKEEALMKFGSDLDSLKGKLRDEAYKKNETARQLYDAYNNLKSAPIQEYIDGYDEQSANAEYRRRKALLDADASFNTQLSDLNAKREAFKKVVAEGKIAGNPDYDNAKRELDAAKSTLESTLASHNISAATISDSGEFNMIGDIKMDQFTARQKRDQELEGLRNAMEAAADAFVHEKAMDVTSNTYRDIATFLSEHASYIGQNGSVQVTVGYEKNKDGSDDYSRPVKMSIDDMMRQSFGQAASQGKFTPDDVFKAQSGIKLEFVNRTTIDGHAYKNIVYKLSDDGNTYVPYGVDDITGREVSLTPGSYPSYKKEEFFKVIADKITNKEFKKASSDTAVSRAADRGKTSATYVRNNDYADKVSMKRQTEEARSGKK